MNKPLNAPQRIEDRQTMRVVLTKPAVHRMFDEAAIGEVVRSVDYEQNLRQELKRLAVSLLVTW